MKTPLQIAQEVRGLAAKICEDIAEKSNTYAKMDVANACEDAIRALDLSGIVDALSQSPQTAQPTGDWNAAVEAAKQKCMGNDGYSTLTKMSFAEAIESLKRQPSEASAEDANIGLKDRLISAAENSSCRDLLLNARDYIDSLERNIEKYRSAENARMDAALLSRSAPAATVQTQPVDSEADRNTLEQVTAYLDYALGNKDFKWPEGARYGATYAVSAAQVILSAPSEPKERDRLTVLQEAIRQAAEILLHTNRSPDQQEALDVLMVAHSAQGEEK